MIHTLHWVNNLNIETKILGLNFIKSWCWCIMMTLPSQNINTWKRLVKIKWEFNGLLNIVKTSFLYFQATCFNMKYIKTEKKTVFLNWSLIVNCKTVNTECLIQLHYILVKFFVYILFIWLVYIWLLFRLALYTQSHLKGREKEINK